ncbi:MAG: VWA domain-containing protein [Acidobacteria bacterium]|nr:VWA domain-containing protein [Acidobacteriota bacterium]
MATVAAIALTILSIGWVMADDPIETPSGTFYQPLSVPLVNVEVIATDSDGAPIRGLTKSDFEIFEDGEPVAITHFFAADSRAEAPQSAGARSTVPGSINQDLYLVVYLDDATVDRRLRTSALAHLRQFLDQPIPPNVNTMLVRFDGSLHVESDFSRRPDELIEDLDRIRRTPAVNVTRDGEVLIRNMQSTAANPRPEVGNPPRGPWFPDAYPALKEAEEERRRDRFSYLPEIRAFAEASRVRNRASLLALTQFVRYMTGVPGRKVVLWVGSFEMRAGENLYQTWRDLFPEQARHEAVNPMMETMRHDLTRDLRDLVEHANSHRVSFYTLGSLAAGVPSSAESNMRIFDGTGVPGQQSSQNLHGRNDALVIMSEFTGGRMLTDGPAFDEQLEQVAADLRSYYSLAYTPRAPGDGEYHKITINLRREGVKLRHRLGYRDSGSRDRTADRTLAAALLGVADNPLGIAVECQQEEPRDDRNYLVPVTVQIPIGELVLLPEAERHTAQISIFFVICDEVGRPSEVYERAYPIEIANDQLLAAVGQRADFTIGMLLREGSHRIAVSVRDERSAIESTEFVDVVVGTGDEDTTG